MLHTIKIIVLCCCASGVLANELESLETSLNDIDARLKTLEADVKQRAGDHKRHLKALKRIDEEQAALAENIAVLEREQAIQKARYERLEQDVEQTRLTLKKHHEVLDALVVWDYQNTTRPEAVSNSIEKTYRTYIARDIARFTKNIRVQIDALNLQLTEQNEVLRKQAITKDARQKKLSALKLKETERLALLKKNENHIKNKKQAQADLFKNQKKLLSTLRSLKSSQQNTHTMFDKSSRWSWPVKGKVTHRFGEPRAGSELQWQGLAINAPNGTEVKVIASGEVVFSDWLPGLGFLTIVDHGQDTLSLYGFNQKNLKKAGDMVAASDVIALVGQSGGREQSGLYFEVRREAAPINPETWLTQ